MALTPMTRASIGRIFSTLSLALLASTPLGAHSFKVQANDTFQLNLDSGCLDIGTPSDPATSSATAPAGGNVGESSQSGGSTRRLLKLGDVRSTWGGKHDHGVMNNAVTLAPQPKCPIFQAIATDEPDYFLLSPDGGNTCIGLSEYANPSMYLQRGDDPKRSQLAELIPLQSVDCNPGCKIPNIGCGIPFSFNDCSDDTISCLDISVKGNLRYGNGGMSQTAAWATKLMAQPLRILDPYNKDVWSYQIQPNNTQVYLGHDYDGQDPLSKYEEERANFREEGRTEREKDIETFREEWKKEGKNERAVNWILDHNTYAALQVWSAQCITCQGLNASLGGGLRTSAKWELVPGGTNPMGAPQELSVSNGVQDMRGQSQTTSTTHTHSVALAFSNAIMFGYEGKHFQFTDTLTTTVTTTNTVSNEVANEIASSTTASTSSEFTQSCPSSSELYLRNNQGYQLGVAMWQWVVRGEYQIQSQSATPWATYWSHHVVCTYGDVPETYGPPPRCPPTYCKGGAANNCQTCSSYEWQNFTTFSNPADPLTSNPYESPAALTDSKDKKDKEEDKQSKEKPADTTDVVKNDFMASGDAEATGSDNSGHSSNSDHSAIIIAVVVGFVGAGLVGGVVFGVYRKHHSRMHPQSSGYQEALMPEQIN